MILKLTTEKSDAGQTLASPIDYCGGTPVQSLGHCEDDFALSDYILAVLVSVDLCSFELASLAKRENVGRRC